MVASIRTLAIQQAVDTLSIAANKAAASLVALLDDADPKVRLAAAAKVFTSITPLTELHELRADIAELKEQMSNGTRLKVAN